jgi:3'(2'), 5'-bisphosphate nucleotidase
MFSAPVGYARFYNSFASGLCLIAEKGREMSRTLLEKHLVTALVAAKKAGEAILEVYHGEIDVSYKEDDSPLTLADKRAHSAIASHLSSDSSSGIPVLSEEGKHTPYEERKGWEYYWLVDPLDGTKEFVKRSDEFTVNIALIEKNRPVLGVVFLPAMGCLYFAAEGLGSYKLEDVETIGQLVTGAGEFSDANKALKALIEAANRLPVQHSFKKSRDQLNLVGSRSHGTEALSDFVEKMKQQYKKVDFVPAGSALKLCLVAEGNADIYPRFGPTMEWDTAAGHCVVEQSGGKVVDMKKKAPLDYNKRDLHNPHFVCIAKHFRGVSLSL